MRDHRRFTSQTKMPIYFAHPHSPWERGTNENTNGLLWQCFPAGTHFNKVSRGEIKRVQTMLNDRPRNILNWHSLAPAFHHLLRSDLECTLFPHRSGDRTMDRRQPRRHSIPFPSNRSADTTCRVPGWRPHRSPVAARTTLVRTSVLPCFRIHANT